MSAILRIDVDQNYGKYPKIERIMRYGRRNLHLPIINSLGHSFYLEKLLEDMENRDIRGNFYFRKSTFPNKKSCLNTMKNHEIGYHAENTKQKLFSRGLKEIQNKFKVNGLSIHGPHKNIDKYIQLSKKFKLKYVLGNLEDPRKKMEIKNDVVYFPSAFWINKRSRTSGFSINWLKKEAERRDIVVLFHPSTWFKEKQEREDYEKIVNKIDEFKLMGEVLESNAGRT